MSNPTAEDIVKVAKSGNTGEVKTLTDIKLEAFEKRLSEMEKINAELRAANAELYAYASSLSQPAAQPAAQPNAAVQTATAGAPGATLQPQAVQYVSAQTVQPSADQAAIQAAKQKEEENLNSVLASMGYRKAAASQSSNDNVKDGM